MSMSLPAAQAPVPLTRRPSAGLLRSGCGFWKISWYQGGASESKASIPVYPGALHWIIKCTHDSLPPLNSFGSALFLFHSWGPGCGLWEETARWWKGVRGWVLSSHPRLSWACRILGDPDPWSTVWISSCSRGSPLRCTHRAFFSASGVAIDSADKSLQVFLFPQNSIRIRISFFHGTEQQVVHFMSQGIVQLPLCFYPHLNQ